MRRPALILALVRARIAPALAMPLAAVLLLVSFAGCLATKVNVRSDGPSEDTGVLVRVYADPDAAKAKRTEAAGTLVELFRLEKGGAETFIQRSLAGEWGVSRLKPGRYRLRVVAVLDAGGHIRDARSGDRETDFTVGAGQTAEVKIILKKTPTGLIVALTVTVVVLVVALAIILGKNDITPPAPPVVFSHLPPPPLPRIVVAPEFWVAVAADAQAHKRIPPPQVTSVFPEPGSAVASSRVMPTLTLSQPIDEGKIRTDTLRMLGSRSGLVPGTTTVHRGLLRFEPARELTPGETVTVTVRASGLVNPDGTRLAEDFSWSFQIAE